MKNKLQRTFKSNNQANLFQQICNFVCDGDDSGTYIPRISSVSLKEDKTARDRMEYTYQAIVHYTKSDML